MPVDITDVSAFTSPVTAPAGSDPADAASVVSPVQKLSNRSRFLLDMMGGAPADRTIFIGPRVGDGEAGWEGQAASAIKKTCAGNTQILTINLSDHLPSGATLKEVHAGIQPGAARVSPNGLKLEVLRVALSTFPGSEPASTTLGVQDEDDGTGNRQYLAVTGLTEVIDRDANTIMVAITSGNTAATNNDKYYGLKVVFTDPGPRSF